MASFIFKVLLFIVFFINVCHAVGLRLPLPPDILDECSNLAGFSVETPSLEPPPTFLSVNYLIIGVFVGFIVLSVLLCNKALSTSSGKNICYIFLI